jgi:hypothetical protein
VSVWFARRVVGNAGGILVLGFTMVNFPALWVFTQIRTEAPSVFLSLVASVAWFYRSGSALRWALAPSLLVWATTFRLTYAFSLAAVCLLIAYELRGSRRLLLMTTAIVVANGIIAAWPMLAFPAESYFHILVSQLTRAGRLGWEDAPLWMRFWFFGQPGANFAEILLVSCLPGFLVISSWRRGWRPQLSNRDDPRTVLLCLFGMALITYLPLLMFKVGFISYFVNTSLLLTLAIGIGVPIAARLSERRIWIWTFVGLVWMVALSVGIYKIEHWVQPGSVTITQFAPIRDRVQRLAPNGCTMMTFETQLAAEIGCDVTPGLEYSHFSFFRELSNSDARAHGVLNQQLLVADLSRDPPEFVALTWSALEKITGVKQDKDEPEGRRPILNAMRGRYRFLTKVGIPVGPSHVFGTQIYIYARNDLKQPQRPRRR